MFRVFRLSIDFKKTNGLNDLYYIGSSDVVLECIIITHFLARKLSVVRSLILFFCKLYFI